MSPLVFALSTAIIALVAFLIFYINKKFAEMQKPTDSMSLLVQTVADLRRDVESSQGKNREELQKRLDSLTTMLKRQQSDSSLTIQKQFDQSAAIIRDVTKNLTGLLETNKQVLGFTESMKSLESILKNPKQRGILGEYFLETLLSNVFAPEQYKMQYKFENGEIVDAVIFYNDSIIPIDAKFSLEKYNQMINEDNKEKREALERAFKTDVKNRIDETSKYIRPSENTTDFAFMFIPAEGVYYNLLAQSVGTLDVNSQHLVEYAFRKHVIIVSPSSLFAYLETVMHGLKSIKMQESLKEVLKNIEQLGRHVGAYDKYMQNLGKNLSTTVSTYNNASREFKKIDKDVYRITGGQSGGGVEVLALEKPLDEEN